MINEELVNELIRHRNEVQNDFGWNTTLQTALDAAIAALKAEPCEDAIKRESVLNTLDAMDAALDEDRTVEAYKELLKECYKELPPVTPKPTECEDAVSREAVMQALTKLGYGDEENGADAEYMSALWDIAKEIESLPPVIPKPRTGHWIVEESESNINVKCSCCNYIVNYFWSDWNKANYCPNCGAKMEGVSE